MRNQQNTRAVANIVQNPYEVAENSFLRDTGANFISPKDIQRLFANDIYLRMRGITIADKEVARMEGVIARHLSSEKIAKKVDMIMHNTQGNRPPLIATLPTEFMFHNQSKPFSIHQLNKRTPIDASYDQQYLGTEKNHQTYPDTLKVYTNGPLKGSFGMSYDNQLELQKELIGADAEIGIEAYIVMLLDRWKSGDNSAIESQQGVMRLNVLALDKCPTIIRLGEMEGSFSSRLASGSLGKGEFSGIGASLSLLKNS